MEKIKAVLKSKSFKETKSKLFTLDLKYSRQIFRADWGRLANFITISHCCFFMEETFVLTLVILHFLCGQDWSVSIKYLIVLLTNIILTVITKGYWRRPRPSDSECTCKSKTLFFRKK